MQAGAIKNITRYLYSLLILCSLLLVSTSGHAELKPGVTYDQTNYQEIKELLFPSLLNWVKEGKVALPTGKLEFEWKKGDAFLAASEKNEGKYEINADGMLVEKGNGKAPAFVYGFPFPRIDPQDPQAAAKIMENHTAQLLSMGTHRIPNRSKWIGGNGEIQREVTADVTFLFYQQRPDGPIPNRENFLFRQLNNVLEPYSYRGTNHMLWVYNDGRQNSGLVYVPSLRRARKISTSDSSNPSLGSDMAPDDNYGWMGKNSTMKWRLLGEKTLLMPFSSPKKFIVKEFPDGANARVFTDIKLGHEVPGWKGAPWAPVTAIWSPVSFWIIEAKPKNPNYFYGKQILYIDKEAYTNHMKEIFDQKERYWKTSLYIGGYQITTAGRDIIGALDFGMMVDEKTDHCTYLKVIELEGADNRMNLPVSVLGPQNFSEDAFIQTTK